VSLQLENDGMRPFFVLSSLKVTLSHCGTESVPRLIDKSTPAVVCTYLRLLVTAVVKETEVSGSVK
jgi:hypothetical protein